MHGVHLHSVDPGEYDADLPPPVAEAKEALPPPPPRLTRPLIIVQSPVIYFAITLIGIHSIST